MARSLTSGMQTAIDADLVRPAFLVQAEFASGIVYLWSGIGTLTWNGIDWQGVGTLGQIGALPETSTLQAQGLSLSLSSIPQDILGDVLDEIRHGKPATVWFATFNPDGTVIADPYKAFAGRIDAAQIQEDGKTAVATITVESRIIDFNRPRERRYTHEDQQIDFPGDRGFEYVPSVQQWVGTWGGANA